MRPKLIFGDFKANHFIKSERNWMFKTFKANHFNISEQKRILESFDENWIQTANEAKKQCWQLWYEISLRYQIRAFRQFQICRRAGELPRVSWQDSRREEPLENRPIGDQLGRQPTNHRRGRPIANLAPNCISEMYQLKTCFGNSRKWSGVGIVWYLKRLTISTKNNNVMMMKYVFTISVAKFHCQLEKPRLSANISFICVTLFFSTH